jgi:hypothetical protein
LERRREERFLLTLRVTLSLQPLDREMISMPVVTRDISSAGAFYFSFADVKVGQKLLCQIYLSPEKNAEFGDNGGVIYVDGVVVRKETCGVAVQFDSNYSIVSKYS